MNKTLTSRILTFILLLVLLGLTSLLFIKPAKPQAREVREVSSHWFLLARKSNSEQLYYGVPGDVARSSLVKSFQVKVGIPGERPTPLPELLGKEYWVVTEKLEAAEDPETGPYFLTLNIPVSEEEPYGPSPYLECEGQCNWVRPGNFGLHGVAGDASRLGPEDAGSSGCIRHSDEDITYLYNLLDPSKEEIRYYIKDV